MNSSLVSSLLQGANTLFGMIFGNAEKRETYDAESRAGAQAQFAAEFATSHAGWFHNLIDAINRLPRPAITLYLGWLVFVLPIQNMDFFVRIMRAYSAVPELMWYLVGTVFLFYFGGRMQEKKLRITKKEVARANEIAEEAALPWR